jgi:hypothetical protein
MAINPNSIFSSGAILTAAQMNRLPWGILGYESLTTGFSTSATHTTFQDEGLDASCSYGADRMLAVTLNVRPYPNGGLQAIYYRVLRGSTEVAKWVVESSVLSASTAGAVTLTAAFASPSTAATETFKVQIAAASSNTQVTSYANTVAVDGPRQFWVEDLGGA